MSGPKSSRYQLTPEQRKALEEARKKELKRRRQLQSLADTAALLQKSLAPFSAYREKAELLFSREGSDLGYREALNEYTKAVSEALDILTLPQNADADRVDTVFHNAKGQTALLKHAETALLKKAAELEERLDRALHGRISAAECSFADIDEEKDLLERRIELRRSLLLAEREALLPTALKKELREALAALKETRDLKTFEAVLYRPLLKKVAEAEKEISHCQEEYRLKYAEYQSLCALSGITPLTVDCSREGLEMLDRYLKTLGYELAYDDEESYINDVLDTVMREMGYHVLASRTVDKKSGRRFSHELYSYRDGTVVNVTTADDGKITMELGKPDKLDRLPTESETVVLCREMEAFCRDFAEIEERLKAHGVVVADRITMLPPTADHAQIINTDDYRFYQDEEKSEGKGEPLTSAWQDRLQKRRKVFRSHHAMRKKE